MRVVKLGGSLAGWAGLTQCLASLAESHCIIVPGGGPFADQVRHVHRIWQFDEGTAHGMALLAMAQFGLMLTGIEPRLAAGREVSRLQDLIAEGRSAVWLPEPEDVELRAVPASWDITSDSLSLWLASRLGASELVLVKSAPLPGGGLDVARLSAARLVDRAFPAFNAAAGCALWIAEREHHALLRGPLCETPHLRRVPRDQARPNACPG